MRLSLHTRHPALGGSSGAIAHSASPVATLPLMFLRLTTDPSVQREKRDHTEQQHTTSQLIRNFCRQHSEIMKKVGVGAIWRDSLFQRLGTVR